MWLWILAILFLLLVWGVWFILAPVDPGPQAEIVPLWVPIVCTLVVIGIIVGVYVYRRIRAARAARALEKAIAQQAQDQAMSAKPEMRPEIQELQRQVLQGIDSLKRSKLGTKSGAAALYELPWYVIVGPPGAGKTTALRHSGLSFPFLDPNGGGVRGVGGTRNCDWWFTNDAILLDTAGRYTTESDDRDEWMAFLEMLLKYRSHKPLNGVMVAVSINELLDATEEGIEATAKKVRERIDEIQETLKMVLPVYVLFTKADLVAGFSEFFGGLKRSERGQPWGATLRLEDPKTEPGKIFDEEFDILVERLHKHALKRMGSERNRKTKEKVYQFPLEFAAVKRNLSDFMAQAFSPGGSKEQTPVLRGFYFTSGTQEGKPLDRVVGAMGRAFGLRGSNDESEEDKPQDIESRSYFLKEVFTDIVFPDADLAARTEGELRRRRLQRFAAAAVAFVIALLFLVPSVLSFSKNQDLVAETERISGEAANIAWDDGTEAAVKIDKLDKLRSHAEMLDAWREEGPPLSYTWFMYQGDDLFDPLLQQYISTLQLGMVMPVRERLEQKLQVVTGAKYLEDYNTLKTYLLLNDKVHLQEFSDWQAGRLTQVWAEILRPTTDLSEADLKLKIAPHVKYYVDLQRRGVIPGEPIDQGLVERTRAILSRVTASQRYYDQFVTALVDQKYDESGPNSYENLVYPPVTLNDLFFDRPEVLSIVRSKKNDREGSFQEVQGPFTTKGRDQVLASLKDGQSALEREKWVVPLTKEEELQGDKIQQALDRVRQDYDSEYIRQWVAFFRDVNVTTPKNNKEAIDEFVLLSTPDWPYQRLLLALKDNTQFQKPKDDEALDVSGNGKDSIVDQLRRKARARVQTKLRIDVNNVLPGDAAAGKAYDPVPDKFKSMVDFGISEPAVVPEGQPPPPAEEPPLATYINNLEQLAAEMAVVEDGPPNADPTNATQLFSTAVKDTQALLTQMDETGQELMEPLLMNPLKQAYKAVVKGAGGAASGLWEVTVWPPYRDTIKDRYPFNVASRRDASYEDFVAFYAPEGGVLWAFYDENLKPFHMQIGHDFIPKAHLQTRPKPARPFTPFSPRMYPCLKRSHEISDAIWPRGQAEPGVEFEVNMKTVSPIVSEVIFELDGQKRRYRNEKEFWHKFKWPGPDEPLTGARIQVRGAGGLDEEITRDGPWGMFRLFESADEISAQKDNDDVFEVTWQMTAPPVTITMEVKPTRANNPFPKSFFRETNCPPSIGDSFGE